MGRNHALERHHHLYIPPTVPSHSSALLHTFKFPSAVSPLTSLSTSTLSSLAAGDKIPGFKVSAAFWTDLHSNIFTELDSNHESFEDTSYSLYPSWTHTQPVHFTRTLSSLTCADVAASASRRVASRSTDDAGGQESRDAAREDGIPTLMTFAAEDNDAKAEALHIVADSVAQQRNIAFRALIFHPMSLAVLAAALAMLMHLFTYGRSKDWINIAATFTAVVMAFAGGTRVVCRPYISEAEQVGTWRWLDRGRTAEEQEQAGVRILGDSDEVLLTKFGGEHVAAIIFRGVRPISFPASPAGNKRSRRASSPSKHTKIVIRGWSVRQKYKRKGIGSALLDDAIRVGKEKGWLVDGVEFAQDHANHKRVLPAMFNGAMDTYVDIAQLTLDKKVQELAVSSEKGRKRR